MGNLCSSSPAKPQPALQARGGGDGQKGSTTPASEGPQVSIMFRGLELERTTVGRLASQGQSKLTGAEAKVSRLRSLAKAAGSDQARAEVIAFRARDYARAAGADMVQVDVAAAESDTETIIELIEEAQARETVDEYRAGCVCDGCGASLADVPVYHGELEPENSLGLRALDVCQACAADVPAAEARWVARMKLQKLDKAEESLYQSRTFQRLMAASKDLELQTMALMLYPHSGRLGFELLQPDPNVPTPPKAVVCSMLRRETELRNSSMTQHLLDCLRSSGLSGDYGCKSDREVFESIKAQVVHEFDLRPEYVDVLNSAVARFGGDPDIIQSANYLRYNRAMQGSLHVGQQVDGEIALASLDGTMISLRQRLAIDVADSRPVAVIAGSIT